jgi:class 3 adenylate cyclase
MSADTNWPSDVEIAHVLFMDVVGYTRLSMDQQVRLIAQLQKTLRGTADFQRGEALKEMLCVPAGDGVALVFFRDPVAPARCALQLAEALGRPPTIELRMGIHSGPVFRIKDINSNAAVSGGGINFAQRVMDCGDTGHILLSKTCAEFLSQLGDWGPRLHDLGPCLIKHGETLHLYNLYTGALGNPAVPKRVALPAAWVERAPVEGPGAGQATPAAGAPAPSVAPVAVKVAILYKRNAQPDEGLLKLLESRLTEAGHRVFIDRHLTVGVEWAREIERQVRTADAVIALLSAASIQSEMLAYEVEIAHAAAQQQQGRPRLLPVRVGYAGPLTETLARILSPIQHTLWESTADDQRVTEELLRGLTLPPTQQGLALPPKLEAVGGAVPLDSRFYVVRPTDEDFRNAIARRDSTVLIKGARQMGKTSLLARGLQQAREAGAKVVLTDFQMLNAAHLESVETLYLTLGEWIATQLDLEVLPQDHWNPRSGPNINFQRYFRREILGKMLDHLVWGMDEVDRLFAYPFASEVFGLFRSWHNARSLEPDGPWSRLTLAIAYATEAHLFITDVNQSPFNVGTRLGLEDFTLEQVTDLNRRHGLPLPGPKELTRFFELVGGHPYLVRRALHELASRGLTFDAFAALADRDEGIFGDHLRRMLVLLAKEPEMAAVVRGVLQGQPCPTAESFYRLRASGIMAGDSAHDVRLRCQLYGAYLRRHLL